MIGYFRFKTKWATEKKMKSVFEPLSTTEFKRRIGDSFPAVYLTVISIIQGVALGILAYNTFGYIKDPKLVEPWIRFLPYSAICFILIIILTCEYTWFIGVFKWSPKIWDTIVPFALGLSEVVPMFYLTNPQSWWLLTAIFCCVGAAGFFNTLRNCKQLMFGENKQAYRRTINTLKCDILLALIAALNCVFAWNFSSRKNWWLEIPFYIIFIALAVYMIYKEEKFLNELHKDFGLVR